MKRLLTALICLVTAAGCEQSELAYSANAEDPTGIAKQEEAWSAQDNPALFSENLQMTLDALPSSGEVQNVPWAGSDWPTFEDSINQRWAGENSDSPAMKYQKAFGGTDVETAVSRYHGIESVTQGECVVSSECKTDLGEVCAKRLGAAKGRCIPSWWGMSQAWTSASILWPEPKRPVTRNDITFQVQDLKALASLVHDRAQYKFVSLRCSKNDGAGEIPLDAYGRPTGESNCRDTNAGTYHVLLANYLGTLHQSFAEDRILDDEVWNRPLRAFRVLEKRPVTVGEANALVGATAVAGISVTRSGAVARNGWAHLGAFTVAPGENVRVQMTGSGDADLYVRFGQQPDPNAYQCRPYAAGSAEDCDLTVPAGTTQVFVSVNGYADTSQYTVIITTGGTAATSYLFNANAKSFVYVRAEVDYISVSSASTGYIGANIGQYTRTDSYEYVLELDADGKIVGGEWVGASKRSHPDFLWLPIGAASSSVAGGAISYANVKSLVDESVTEPGTGGSGEERIVELNGVVTRNQLKNYGPYNVATGSTLTVEMTGTGDADLYGRKGAAPTRVLYDCRPYQNGSTETCALAGPGWVYLAVNGYALSSTFKLVVKYREGAAIPPPPTPVNHLNESGSVAQGEMKVFTLAVPAGAQIRVQTTAPNDIDLYLQMDVAPTTTTYLKRGYTVSGNESLEVSVATSGQLYIGVHGYQASSFTLKTSSIPGAGGP
ncbi:MAG: pre-peptidase C-terminal domain-containing protein [Myxococcaceae bacterium]